MTTDNLPHSSTPEATARELVLAIRLRCQLDELGDEWMHVYSEDEATTIITAALAAAEARGSENERLAFERLSMALTGGNASTWDELFHAAEARGAESRQKEVDFLKGELAQLAHFNPDWDMLAATRDSLRECQQLLAEARGPAPQAGWQDIATAPKDGQWIIVSAQRVSSDPMITMLGYWNQRLAWWYRIGASEPSRIYPKLWFPLPPAEAASPSPDLPRGRAAQEDGDK